MAYDTNSRLYMNMATGKTVNRDKNTFSPASNSIGERLAKKRKMNWGAMNSFDKNSMLKEYAGGQYKQDFKNRKSSDSRFWKSNPKNILPKRPMREDDRFKTLPLKPEQKNDYGFRPLSERARTRTPRGESIPYPMPGPSYKPGEYSKLLEDYQGRIRAEELRRTAEIRRRQNGMLKEMIEKMENRY